MKKSFRGLLADQTKERIRLSTNNGLTGYKIVKFKLIAEQPGAVSQESVCKLFSIDPPATNGLVNFDDPTLLAAAYYMDNHNEVYPVASTIVFDNTTFNQDIFITHFAVDTGQKVNYYLELEQVKLSKDEATVATLKDMRGRE